MGAILIVGTGAPAAALTLLSFSPAIRALIIDVIVLRDVMYENTSTLHRWPEIDCVLRGEQ